ncbi:type IV pilus biogenesis protein PilM [Thermanaeromonas sp. C210]|uniref:type IV pilus biogenesis protein PilM n=1 Tax=Thermanaeromonas sp. C210 TaxID=2731925 RepID=UPI00155CD715|nr:pilus assembly protein PilM [Thermanaeromonas sp. C210]GFN23298.1 pilus-associated protein pilM [Thermanaeromonas sp. C210]
MWPVGRRQKGLLGIDIGTAQIKVVAVQGRGRVYRAVGEAPPGGIDNEEEMAAALAQVVEETGWQGRQVVSAVDGPRVMVRYLQLPPMPEREVRAGLPYEADKYLPVGTGDMVLDCAVLDPEPGPREQIEVLLAAVPRELALSYHRLCQRAGLELVALDIVPAALCRALAAETGKEEAIILDLGASSSQVVLVRGGRLLFSRRIGSGVPATRPADTSGEFNTLLDLPQEVRRSLEFYGSQTGRGVNPSRVFLTGGGAYEEGLIDFLHMELDLPVEVGRPYGLGPEYAVSLGLALRESRG